MTKDKTPETFTEVVAGIVNRCKVAHALNKNVNFEPAGAEALGMLLTSMAYRLDRLKSTEDMTDEEFKQYTEDEAKRRGLDNPL